MACKIVYSDNKIIGVNNEKGEPSVLFNSLVRNPHMESVQQAIDIYKNVYTPEFKGAEQALQYRTSQGVFNSYGQALKSIDSGDVQVFSGENLLMNISSNSNPKTYSGFINNALRNDLILDESIFEGGQIVIQTAGATDIMKAVKADILVQDAISYLGAQNITQLDNNNFVFQNRVGKRPVTLKTGEIAYEDSETLNNFSEEQLREKYDNVDDIIFERELDNDPRLRTYGNSKVIQEGSDIPNEQRLKVQLLNLLNNLGIKTLSISNYVEKYGVKNGVEPSAQALADISRKIIAFQDGGISVADLTEETAHFIVEGWDANQVNDLLAVINQTEEWAEFSQQYREVYSQTYSGEELETAIRKEVLGKVLANALQNNFTSETNQNILNRIRQLFLNFIGKVQMVFKPQYINDINLFTDQISRLLKNNELEGYLSNEQIEGSKLRLYSLSRDANDPLAVITATARKAVEILDIQQAKLGSSVGRENVQRLKRTLDQIDDNSKISSISGIVGSVKTQLRYLEQAFKSNDKEGHPFSQEENVVYATMINQMRPILEELKVLLDSKNADEKLIQKELEEVLTGIGELKAKVGLNDNDGVLRNMVDEVAIKHNWTTEQKENYFQTLKAVKKDTVWGMAYFGSLSHAQNPLLNLFGNTIKKTTMDASIYHRYPTRDFLNRLDELGVTPQQLNTLKRGSYLLDEMDWQVIDTTVNTIEKDAYNEFAKTDLSLEDYLIQKRDGSLATLSPDNYNLYRQKIREEIDPYLEKPYNDKYYETKKQLYADLNISLDTQKWLSEISSDVAKIYSLAKNSEGIIELTQSLKFELERISKERAYSKSPYGSDGDFREGLDGFINNEGQLELTLLDNPSDEARRAYELYLLDKEFLKNLQKTEKGIPQKFKDTVLGLTPQEGLEYIRLNSYIGFNQSFWDSIGGNESLSQRLENVEDERAQEIVLEMKRLQGARNNILKANRVLNQPSETDFERMSRTERDNVRDFTERLQDLYQEASGFFTREAGEQIETTTENTPNKAYYDALTNNGKTSTDDKIDFIKDHVTASDKLKIEKAEIFARDLGAGKVVSIPKRYENVFNKDYNSLNPLEKQLAIAEDLIKYSESKLLPYFSRFAPLGYENIMSELESGARPLSTLFEENSPITVTPNYSFYEAVENPDINPNYVKNYEGGYYQFKKSGRNKEGQSFRSQEFIDTFGLDKNGEPTRNQKLYQARTALLDYHRDSLTATADLGNHNIFKLPQQSKGSLSKFRSFMKNPNTDKISETLKDVFAYREEDVATGEVIQGNIAANVEDMKIIPKYGMRELANQQDLSDELLTSYNWFHQQATLYKARKENIGNVLALKEAVLNDNYGGKAAEATATYKMFNSAYDEFYMGVKESFEYNVPIYKGYSVNISKLLRLFGNFVRFRNLGFAVISPITSFLTADVQFRLENRIGEFINKPASALAAKEFRKLAGSSINEALELKSSARLNVIGEHFHVYSQEERLNNSSFNKYARALVKVPYASHSAMNFPVMPKVMLSVLYDYRVVDGQIMNYNEYKRNNPQMAALELKNTWSASEKNAVYNFIDTNDGKLTYNAEKLKPLLSVDNYDQYMKLKNEAIFQRVSQVSQLIDGNISPEEKSLASRNMVLQLFMTHRNWLTVATQRRFKGTHLSLDTGQFERGSYSTLGSFIKGYIEQFKKSDIKEIKTDFKDYWATLSTQDRVNMQRNAKDFAVVNLLMLVGLLLSKIADDPDNKDLYALQSANYLMLRLCNESASSGVAIPLSYYDTIDSAFVGLNTIPEILRVSEIGDDEIITSGKFKGFTKGERYVLRNTGFGKEYAGLSNPVSTKNSYLLNNDSFINFIPVSYFFAD